MQRQRPLRVARALLWAMLLPAAAAGDARADEPVVYRWIDSAGVSHYTTQPSRIPDEYEDSVQEIRRSAPGSSPSGLVRVPEAPPAPAGPAPTATSPPPAVAAPPPEPAAPKVTPEGEFEEAPLGSPKAGPAADRPSADSAGKTTEPAAAAPAGPDVAAPPPGFIRGTAASPRPTPPSTPPEAPRAPAEPLSPEAEQALDQRIVALESEIESDQGRLQNILSQPPAADGPRIAEREDFREIAQRLPKLQADLKALREQRTRTSGL